MSGQYGCAITYVADHVSDERRGCTSWLQTSPTLGIVLSPLIVIIAARTYFRR